MVSEYFSDDLVPQFTQSHQKNWMQMVLSNKFRILWPVRYWPRKLATTVSKSWDQKAISLISSSPSVPISERMNGVEHTKIEFASKIRFGPIYGEVCSSTESVFMWFWLIEESSFAGYNLRISLSLSWEYFDTKNSRVWKFYH